ncbi:preprotein translocase subunit SecY [candidate division WWE3 bacterium CG10_big_fil_rev_8_21_14_0_10_32_10]|uniref:Protein translocase subunit SecY n=1 Tax=candidate division WWE3 bacterium CG10_big_fil_rev_8_21_14_0_10_32_10 TaxID=1975090 RepID=A0A2H0RB36_UNCKA|nr:MAG: preprotein translocase subunit SecY [candidate division WWE3 bacterium CG10_big_fil_rev_8_21_14_0_10_32_10]
MFSTLKKSFQIKAIRKKIFIVLFIILISRIVAHIPLPGIDREGLSSLFSSNQLLGLIDLFQGGSLSRFSLASVGLSPYITASIVIQMLTMVIPSMEELSKEGAYGYEKINRYTKLLTLPLSLLQSFGLFILFSKQGLFQSLGILDITTIIIALVAGSFILMWLGDLITEQNIGQGISILILVSILSRLPSSFQSLLVASQSGNILNILLFLVVSAAVVAGVVFVTDAVRKIQIAYANANTQNYQADSYLPLRVNQAGVIPIIFAISVVLIPSILGGFLSQLSNNNFANIGSFLTENFRTDSLYYNVFYFVLVVIFTFFYTAVSFNPEKVADDLKNRGGFIPGIRPGRATEDYLNKILTRITLVGALFLGIVAILPSIASVITGVNVITIGGTGVLIVVSVIIEMLKQLESQIIMYEYDDIALT